MSSEGTPPDKKNSLILWKRYCLRSCDSSGSGMMGGKSVGDGVQFSS